jgi:hypothetical protein
MKSLFFSPDVSQIELAGKAFQQAGVQCRVRTLPEATRQAGKSCETELRIRNAKDANTPTQP